MRTLCAAARLAQEPAPGFKTPSLEAHAPAVARALVAAAWPARLAAAALRGRVIVGVPADGGGRIAGDVCPQPL